MAMLKSIHIQGFKSIRDARVDLGRVNVLIGANASGKSNLVAFFQLLVDAASSHLQVHIAKVGGAASLLRFGPNVTGFLSASLHIAPDEPPEWDFLFNLQHTNDDRLAFTRDTLTRSGGSAPSATTAAGSGHLESVALQDRVFPGFQLNPREEHNLGSVVALMKRIRAYQFHDTSPSAELRRSVYIDDSRELRYGAGNLAAVLHKYAKVKPAYYRRILATIRQVFPQFDDFVLEPDALAPTQIKLNWRERGQDNLFGPHQFSDGTLRFIAMATLLLQPEEELPKVIVIDEPELGLHPNAITVLAALIHKAAHHSQLVVATQSVTLLDQFDPEEVIVVERDRVHNATEFRRLDAPSLAGWLEEYTLGDLWRKNVIGGGPH